MKFVEAGLPQSATDTVLITFNYSVAGRARRIFFFYAARLISQWFTLEIDHVRNSYEKFRFKIFSGCEVCLEEYNR